MRRPRSHQTGLPRAAERNLSTQAPGTLSSATSSFNPHDNSHNFVVVSHLKPPQNPMFAGLVSCQVLFLCYALFTAFHVAEVSYALMLRLFVFA